MTSVDDVVLLQEKIESLEESLRIEKTIRQFQETIILQKNKDEIYSLLVDQISKLIHVKAHIIYFIDSKYEFIPQNTKSIAKENLEKGEALMLDGFFVWALNRRKASILPAEKIGSTSLLIPLIGVEPFGLIYFQIDPKDESYASNIVSILTFIAREAALYVENSILVEREKYAKQLEALNKEMSHAYEMVGNLVLEKDKVYKELEKSQLALDKKARDLESNNKELIRINQKLKETQAQLEEYGKTLEIKVKERTQDLERMNAKLELTTGRLQKTNKKLNEVDQMKNDFLSFTAHELRTPLTSINAFTELLLLEPKAMEKKDEFLSIIKSETNRLTRLTNDLLDIIKIEAGKMNWNFVNMNLLDILKHALKINTAMAEQVNISLKHQFPSSLPTIRIDRDKILQVLSNLIGNAIKFTPDYGSIDVSVKTLNASDFKKLRGISKKGLAASEFVLISIKDNGPGIDKKDVRKVFQKFKQIRGQKGRYKGTGLGLPISKDIIHAHRGEIWLESAVGHGSIFHFVLPIIQC